MMQLVLKEKSGLMRQMEFFVRVYNDGVAFRYKLLVTMAKNGGFVAVIKRK